MFFLVGMLVSIMSALIPNMIESFQINYTVAATLPFSFYLSVTFLSFPAGIANERFPSKKILLFSLYLVLPGVLLFVIFLDYSTSLISLFIIGGAVAIIQVSSVPLLRRICGPDNFAFHSAVKRKTVSYKNYLWPIPNSEMNYNKLLDPSKDQKFRLLK